MICDPTEFDVGPTSTASVVVPNLISNFYSSLHVCSKCCMLFHGKIRCSKKYRALTDTSSLVLHIYSSNGIFHFIWVISVSIFDRLVHPVFTGPGPMSILKKAFKWVYLFQNSLWGGQPRFLHPCHRETQRNQGGVEKNQQQEEVFFPVSHQ